MEDVPSPSTLKELIENLKRDIPLTRYSLVEKSRKGNYNFGYLSSDEEN